MPKQVAKVGDIFWVPIEDGSLVLGQIVEIKREVLNSITCAFFESAGSAENADLSKPFSVQFVTKDLFSNGTWARSSNEPVQIDEKSFPYRETESEAWVGAKVIGSGIIKMFLSAFFGLRDWNEMNDPEYYQKLLLPGVRRGGNA